MFLGSCEPARSGYSLLIQTVFEGVVPYERDFKGHPIVYDTLAEAKRALVEGIVDRLNEYIAGERDFDDAITVEEYIREVTVYPDGSMRDGDGNLHFPA